MNSKALQILKKYFGYDSFKSGQESVIDTILAGRDSFAIMPTGAGKSICYQVSGLLLPGITIVISPLISLMQNQVKALNDAGIHAAYINSSLSDAQISKVLKFAREGRYKIIYAAPERLENNEFTWFATNAEISMVTVDEAHCISGWGQDFRPSYLKIVDFIKRLPKRPIISAFTATATKEVQADIINILALDHPEIVVTGFDRENLYYCVEHTKRKDDYVIDYISKHPNDSGVIYCATRKNVDILTELLSEKGFPVTKYHAGLGAEERKRNQDDFIYDRTPIVVATNAFGMGIDKSNVRYVIHYNMPQSMENYYQEAGRAGRDGEPAQCILLFSAQDVIIAKFLLDKKDFTDIDPENMESIRQRDFKRLHSMENYCRITSCLRKYILDYFGEKTLDSCDNCGNCHCKYQEVDMTAQAKWVINCVYEAKERYGLSVIVGTLLGANRTKLREIGTTEYKSYGSLRDYSETGIRLLISQMIDEGYLFQTDDTYSVLHMGEKMNRLHDENTHVIVRMHEEKESDKKPKKQTKAENADALTLAGMKLFEKLRALRLDIAKEASLPPYIVFSDKTLVDMCAKLPHTREEMLNVNGVGENKFMKYGQRFLDEIESFVSEHPDDITNERMGITDEMSRADIKKVCKKTNKKEFYLTPEQADQFQYGEMYYISEIKDHLNMICDTTSVKKVTIQTIWDVLVNEGLTYEENREGSFIKTRTDKGSVAGIEIVHKTGASGIPYELLRYPENVQELIVDYFVKGTEDYI